MSIITKMLISTAVYWPLKSNESGQIDYDDYGQPQYASPSEVSCRWEERSVEFIDAHGTIQISQAVVFVDTDLVVAGVLLHDVLVNVSDLTAPKKNNGAWEIKRFDKVPNLKGTEFLRTAYL